MWRRTHEDVYTAMIAGMAGDLYGKSFRNFLMDSWEAGNENWTEQHGSRSFATAHGATRLTPYLPVLDGTRGRQRGQRSDAFLWDFRRTLAEKCSPKITSRHLHRGDPSQRACSLYSEAMGTDLPTNGDGLAEQGQRQRCRWVSSGRPRPASATCRLAHCGYARSRLCRAHLRQADRGGRVVHYDHRHARLGTVALLLEAVGG